MIRTLSTLPCMLPENPLTQETQFFFAYESFLQGGSGCVV